MRTFQFAYYCAPVHRRPHLEVGHPVLGVLEAVRHLGDQERAGARLVFAAWLVWFLLPTVRPRGHSIGRQEDADIRERCLKEYADSRPHCDSEGHEDGSMSAPSRMDHGRARTLHAEFPLQPATREGTIGQEGGLELGRSAPGR